MSNSGYAGIHNIYVKLKTFPEGSETVDKFSSWFFEQQQGHFLCFVFCQEQIMILCHDFFTPDFSFPFCTKFMFSLAYFHDLNNMSLYNAK